MNFHPEDFVALSNQVEAEGGNLLERACRGYPVRYKLPDATGKRTWRTCQTAHCNNSALMEIPYNPEARVRIYDDEEPDVIIVDHAGEKKPKDPMKVVVCAIDDCVGLWPRFANLITNRSFQP